MYEIPPQHPPESEREFSVELSEKAEFVDVPHGREGLDSHAVGMARQAVYGSLPETVTPLTPEQTWHKAIVMRGDELYKVRNDELNSRFSFSSDEIDRLKKRNVFEKAMTLLIGSDEMAPISNISRKRPFQELTLRELIQLESQIGAKLFGPIPNGDRREFFNDDLENWIWHEEQKGPDGKITAVTTRYEVRAEGIRKVQQGTLYHIIDGEELHNLSIAVDLYHRNVMRDIYKRDQTDHKLAA